MRRSREMIEQKHYELTAMTDRVLDDNVALGLIDELISTLES